jgi:hypothetical protein
VRTATATTVTLTATPTSRADGRTEDGRITAPPLGEAALGDDQHERERAQAARQFGRR